MAKEVLCVIPARGGSVRTPKKNIKLLNGKPLIAYAIEAAKQSQYVTSIIVSTDDAEIRAVANSYSDYCLNRPENLRGDCPTEDVVIQVVKWLFDHGNYQPDIIVCLEPPQPFRTTEHIDKCVTLLAHKSYDIDSVVTISKISQRPEWMVQLNDAYIKPYTNYWKKDGIIRSPASQEFEELYYINGIVFACKTETLLKYKSMIGKKCVGVITKPEDAFDLDYPEDFEICEMIMKRMKNA